MSVANLIRRVLRNSTDSTTPGQQVSIESSADETHADVEQLETYGLTSNPPANVNEGLCVFVGGQSDHGIMLGWFDKAVRPKGLMPGEVQVYSSFGQSMLFNKDGEVIVTSKSGSTITLDKDGNAVIAPSGLKTMVTGDLLVSQNIIAQGGIGTGGRVPQAGNMSVSGNIAATGDVVGGSVSLDNHTHQGNGSGAPL